MLIQIEDEKVDETGVVEIEKYGESCAKAECKMGNCLAGSNISIYMHNITRQKYACSASTLSLSLSAFQVSL
jgi:hypothetical protein